MDVSKSEQDLELLETLLDGTNPGAADPKPGLGLTIVKSFVEAHGGVVSATSTEGQGATFRFTLPRRESGPDSGDIPSR